MNSKRMMVIVMAAAVLASAGGLVVAAQPGQAATPGSSMQSMGDMPMGRGMMGPDGMMGGPGMMGMMRHCEHMMDGGTSGNAMMPRLPPGNEKLEFQMRAEMMQKIGEIAARYVERIKDGK